MKTVETYKGVTFPWHCDGMGHVTTRFYTGWFDDASYHLLAAAGGDLTSLQQHSLGWADVRTVVEYRHEILANELFVIDSGFEALGTKSLTHHHAMRKLDGTLIATQTMTSVQFHLVERKAVPIEPGLREIIESWLD